MSFWEKHKHNILKYGHIYATIFGLVVINYQLKPASKSLIHRAAVIYSHMLHVLLIVVLPIYFVRNIAPLMESNDLRWQLHLLVNLTNTLLKYITVVVTYIANIVHYDAIREITKTRQELEDDFARCFIGTAAPRKQFELMALLKFLLINVSMLVQIASILLQHYTGAHALRVYITAYTFILWNYTENMADYFYFINISAVRFYQQLNQQLEQLAEEANKMQRRSCRVNRDVQHHLHSNQQLRRGLTMQLCCHLCDALDALLTRYLRIHKMTIDSLHMQQFQMLGLMLTTLITNLTNFYTLYNLYVKRSDMAFDALVAIILSTTYACVFYMDTYVVSLISDHINEELHNINRTMTEFNHVAALDVRLEQTIEAFTLQLLTIKVKFRICGLFDVDRRLIYLTSVTGFSYFITLIQFDLHLNNLK